VSGNILQIGPRAILEAIKEILQTHLPARAAAWETARGYDAGFLKLPDNHCYALSRKAAGVEESCSCRIYIDDSALIEDRTQFPGAGSTDAISRVRVKFRTKSEAGTDTDEQCDGLAECARFVINKYWRAYFTEIRAMNFNVSVDWRGSSIREQYQTTGATWRGRADDNTDEEIDLVCVVTHRMAYAVSYDKDLPTP
jgi:hypothetical protein